MFCSSSACGFSKRAVRLLALLGPILLGPACAQSTTVEGVTFDADAGPAPARMPPTEPLRPEPRVSPEPPASRLMDKMRCGLDLHQALRASARVVACSTPLSGGFFERATMTSVVEAWEVGLLGGNNDHNISYSDFMQGCDYWRCVAAADSCESLAACEAALEPCEEADAVDRCRDGRIERCLWAPPGLALRRPVLDCTSFGAVCEEDARGAACALGECRFGESWKELTSCEGDVLSVCDGALSQDCEADGQRCLAFTVSGEVPVAVCSPASGPVDQAGPVRYAGAVLYDTPVDCAEGVIRFDTLAGGERRFDCRAAGYAGCDERGCVL